MFEVLTETEAQTLIRTLTSGYESSKQLAREIGGWMRATTDYGLRMSYNNDLIAHGSIRAENTSIRWQVWHETGAGHGKA